MLWARGGIRILKGEEEEEAEGRALVLFLWKKTRGHHTKRHNHEPKHSFSCPPPPPFIYLFISTPPTPWMILLFQHIEHGSIRRASTQSQRCVRFNAEYTAVTNILFTHFPCRQIGEDVSYDTRTRWAKNPQGGSEKPRMGPAGAEHKWAISRNTPWI